MKKEDAIIRAQEIANNTQKPAFYSEGPKGWRAFGLNELSPIGIHLAQHEVKPQKPSVRWFRLKIEYTQEYQARYVEKGFSEKDRQAMNKEVRRDVFFDTGKKEGAWSIMSHQGKEFIWMWPHMLEEVKNHGNN